MLITQFVLPVSTLLPWLAYSEECAIICHHCRYQRVGEIRSTLTLCARTQSFLDKESTSAVSFFVNFAHNYVCYSREKFSLEITYISRVMPIKASGFDNYDTPHRSLASVAYVSLEEVRRKVFVWHKTAFTDFVYAPDNTVTTVWYTSELNHFTVKVCSWPFNFCKVVRQ